MNRVVTMCHVGIHEPRWSLGRSPGAEMGAGPGAGAAMSEIVVTTVTRADS
jgi:hypothetical protein